MSEEEKTLDELTFDSDLDDEQMETPDVSQEEDSEPSEDQELEDKQEEPESGEEMEETPEEEPKKESVKWEDLGLPKFDQMTKEQIANEVKRTNQTFGQQANELGELRKKVEQIEKSSQQPKDDGKQSKTSKMTEGQLYDFQTKFQENPGDALDEYFGGKLAETMKDKLNLDETVDEKVKSRMQEEADRREYQRFVEEKPEMQQYTPGAQVLDKPENLGNQRRNVRHLHYLAELGSKNDPLYAPTYAMMKRYPNMSFFEAKKFAELQTSASSSAEQKKEDVKKQKKRLDQTNSRSTKAQKSSKAPPAKSIDDIDIGELE